MNTPIIKNVITKFIILEYYVKTNLSWSYYKPLRLQFAWNSQSLYLSLCDQINVSCVYIYIYEFYMDTRFTRDCSISTTYLSESHVSFIVKSI